MRKPRDFDADLKALNDKAKLLKERKVHQLGDLVIATGADVLSMEQLAGLLLAGIERNDASVKESWRKRGAAFFQQTKRAGGGTGIDAAGTSPTKDGAQSAGG